MLASLFSKARQLLRCSLQVLAQHLGAHLSQEDLLICRLVCKEWRSGLHAGKMHISLMLAVKSTIYNSHRLS